MQQLQELRLPSGLVEKLQEVAARPGVPVPIDRNLLVAVDHALISAFGDTLVDVRESERAAPDEFQSVRLR